MKKNELKTFVKATTRFITIKYFELRMKNNKHSFGLKK